jgi:hypothetical protein
MSILAMQQKQLKKKSPEGDLKALFKGKETTESFSIY